MHKHYMYVFLCLPHDMIIYVLLHLLQRVLIRLLLVVGLTQTPDQQVTATQTLTSETQSEPAREIADTQTGLSNDIYTPDKG